jgi:hypothetical protein
MNFAFALFVSKSSPGLLVLYQKKMDSNKHSQNELFFHSHQCPQK